MEKKGQEEGFSFGLFLVILALVIILSWIFDVKEALKSAIGYLKNLWRFG